MTVILGCQEVFQRDTVTLLSAITLSSKLECLKLTLKESCERLQHIPIYYRKGPRDKDAEGSFHLRTHPEGLLFKNGGIVKTPFFLAQT